MTKNDPSSVDLFPGARGVALAPAAQGVPASRLKWTQPHHAFRVHYYDPLHTGTRHAYFDGYQEARNFAHGRRVYAKPCVVERRPS